MVKHFFPLVIAIAEPCSIHFIGIVRYFRNGVDFMIIVNGAWCSFIFLVRFISELFPITYTLLSISWCFMYYILFIWYWKLLLYLCFCSTRVETLGFSNGVLSTFIINLVEFWIINVKAWSFLWQKILESNYKRYKIPQHILWRQQVWSFV